MHPRLVARIQPLLQGSQTATKASRGGHLVRILIADDHELLRKGIRKFLRKRRDVKVCGEARDGRHAVEQARRLKPDLVLMDISMPGMNGLEATREIRRILPETGILVLSQHNSPEMIRQAWNAGAYGYVVKTEIATALLRGIDRVRAGNLFFDPGIGAPPFEIDAQEITRRDQALGKALGESDGQRRGNPAEPEDSGRSQGAEGDAGPGTTNGRAAEFSELSGLLLQAQDGERRRIARELHDGAGQILAALGVDLEALADRARKSAPFLAEAIQRCQDSVHQLNGEIRTMSYLLHPPLLDQCGLAEALRWYTRGLAERARLSLNIEVPADFERQAPETELAVFRVVQEALTNVYRHSGSKTATIRLSQNDSQLSVEIEDGGRGISPERLAQIEAQGAGVGIRGMRERARQLNGALSIASNGTGTKILLSIPVSQTPGPS